MSNDVWKNARTTRPREAERPAAANPKELRLHGMNAVRAVFASSPERLRKLYLTESRLTDLK